MPKLCDGNTPDHCCYLGERGVCPFLEEDTVPGRRWACGLMREHNDWDKVLADQRYIDVVVPFSDEYMERLGVFYSCKSWPPPNTMCECLNGN